MIHPSDFTDAHRRHWHDAELLYRHACRPNPDQLYGFSGILDRLAEETVQSEVKLPPRHIDKGAEGAREDLESLRVFLRVRDDRVNIPDVFRVGYGLGRRGGVKPVQ